MRSTRFTLANLSSARLFAMVMLVAALWLSHGKAADAEEKRYGGIEIGAKGIKAVVIKVPTGEGNQIEILFAKTANVTIGALTEGRFREKAIADTVKFVDEIFQLIRNDYAVKPDDIHVVASSFVGSVVNCQDLIIKLKEKIGREVKLLKVDEEVKSTLIGLDLLNNSPAALLIDIGSGNTKGGWIAAPTNRFETFQISLGTVSYSSKVKEKLKKTLNPAPSAFLEQARAMANDEIAKPIAERAEAQPELVTRSPIYLSGGAVWAMTTLLYPEKSSDRLVPISSTDVENYRRLLARDPGNFPKADFAKIGDPQLRSKAEEELRNVRRTFTADNLTAGAEILNAIASQLHLEGKSIFFPREGQFAVATATAAPQGVIDSVISKLINPAEGNIVKPNGGDEPREAPLKGGSFQGRRTTPPVPSKALPESNNHSPQFTAN